MTDANLSWENAFSLIRWLSLFRDEAFVVLLSSVPSPASGLRRFFPAAVATFRFFIPIVLLGGNDDCFVKF